MTEITVAMDDLVMIFMIGGLVGMWVAFGGAIYFMFDVKGSTHVRHDPGPWDYYVAGVDAGFDHPTVLRVHACRLGSMRSHVVAEYNERGTTSPEFVAHCKVAAEQYGPITFVYDPSAADLGQQLIVAGLDARKANHDVLPGIRCVQASLVYSDDKAPLMTMEPNMKGNLEYTTYKWRDGGVAGVEKPVKIDDDAVDADRYARMYIMEGRSGYVGMSYLGERPTPQRNIESAWADDVEHEVPERVALMDDPMWASSDERW
ncbi:hypothetical protein LCGC14_2400080 [marine sediment metagenome]|uniref:Terminase large subunit gp17-like C-terminal domain-containing protein n=1 Tax=marine sediment metagenome TaxID=412755 RepID=A0A0F9EQ12_9ZZZZ